MIFSLPDSGFSGEFTAQKRLDRNPGKKLIGFFTNVDEHFLETAFFHVRTIVAFFVELLRHARQQCDRAIEQAINLREADLARVPHETISTLGSLLAAYVSSVFEIEEDQLKKFLRDMLRPSDFIGENKLAAKVLAQSNQRLQRVFALLRYHSARIRPLYDAGQYNTRAGKAKLCPIARPRNVRPNPTKSAWLDGENSL